MKLIEVLSEIRKGNPVFQVKVFNPKGYPKDVVYISFANTLFFRKHVQSQKGDEIVNIYGKEFNISEFVRTVTPFKGSEICARINNKGITIEID